MPNFRCVIEGLVVKYTMFDTRGTPLRALCSVKLKEARLNAKGADAALGTILRRARVYVPPRNDLE
jgi:hypothetical protein